VPYSSWDATLSQALGYMGCGMIIQCDHCSAKFRMDDSKLAGGPVKVRCAKCKGVFVVKKDEASAEEFKLPQELVPPSPAVPASVATATVEPAPQAAPSPWEDGGGFPAEEGAFSFSTEPHAAVEPPAEAAAAASGDGISTNEFDWGSASPAAEAGEAASLDLSGFSAETAVDSSATAPGEFDFGDISFGEPEGEKPQQEEPAARDELSMEFGEVSFASGPSAETATTSFEFSFTPEEEKPQESPSSAADSEGFEFSFEMPPQAPLSAEAVQKGGAPPVPAEFQFVEKPAEEERAEVHLPSSTGSLATGESLAGMMPEEEELPPTSLVSRKKQTSLFPLLVIVGAIFLVVALAGGGAYFFGGPQLFSKVGLGFLVEWYGQKGGEEGGIAIRNIKAEYVANAEGGELFVVRGEAVNNYKKPRASVQVKLSLLASGGTVLRTKNAFCGNILSNDQLATLPMAKIEESMANQFGDSLANLGVKPGAAIPFLVAVSGSPKEAVDFSLLVVGSTVATQ